MSYIPQNEPFNSNTGQITTAGGYASDPSGTLTVSGGVGAYAGITGVSSAFFHDTNYVPAHPSIFVSIDILAGTTNTTSSYINIDPGIYEDNSNALCVELGISTTPGSYSISVLDIVAGTKHYQTPTFPAGQASPLITATGLPPSSVAFCLNANTVYAYYKITPTSPWVLWCYATTFKDYTAVGALTGYYGGFAIWSSNSTSFTVNVSNLQFGYGYNPSVAYQALILGDNPVAYVPGLDPAFPAADIVYGYIDGAPIHPTYQNAAPARLGGSCVAYTANAQSQNFENPFYYILGATPALSTELWFKSTAVTLATQGMSANSVGVFSDISGIGANDWGQAFYGNMQVTWGMGDPIYGVDVVLNSTKSLNDGQWHHVVCTWSGTTGLCTIYIDGQPDTNVGGFPTGTHIGSAGWWSGWNGYGWIGSVSNMAVYGYTLTPVQVLAHYNAGVGGSTTTVYGKFADAKATRPILLTNAANIEPRVWMPKENITVR